ncbi:hypothetical protein ACFPH6_04385 [Streptomyces xiangluensis]|uniref:Uncharacterized protein n=1 Tax=Streptomyces xiangluensis TaxID=2665720 RepID=A0ABV8YIB3_9ACTN
MRAQAKKKTGGGKPAVKKVAAKKAVTLPRGSVHAAYPGTCPACFKDYGKGEVITKVSEGWGTPRLRAPAAVGSRAGVRAEQGQDREQRSLMHRLHAEGHAGGSCPQLQLDRGGLSLVRAASIRTRLHGWGVRGLSALPDPARRAAMTP